MPRPRILYLVHRFPYPPNKGDRIRAFHIIRHLSSRAELHVAALADEPVAAEDAAALSMHCDRLDVVRCGRLSRYLGGIRTGLCGGSISEGMFASREFTRRIAAAAETPFDSVLVSASSMIPYLQSSALNSIPAVVDLVDVDSEKWRAYAGDSRGPRRWLYRFESSRLRRLETRLPNNVQAVTLVSRAEADLYQKIRERECGTGVDDRLPLVQAVCNGVDLDYFAPIERATELSCVFVGAMDYRPNVEGVRWFCRYVWPEVTRRLPDAEFQIVGRNPVAAVQRLSQLPGVEVTGSVDDVRPWVARAGVIVAPLRIARGVQNKVLEAMAMGKAVVATPDALAGIDVDAGRHVLAADGADAFAATVCECLGDGELRMRLGEAGREFVEQRHEWSKSLGSLDRLLGLSTESTQSPARHGSQHLVSVD